MEADLGAVGPAVPPDLVAGIAAAAEEVAGGEVVDGDIVGLPHHDPIAPDGLATGVGGAEGLLARIRTAGTGGSGLGPVDDHRRAVHTPQVDVRRGDDHPSCVAVGGVEPGLRCVSGLVVVARCHEDPVARLGRVDRRLDGLVLAGVPVETSPPGVRCRWHPWWPTSPMTSRTRTASRLPSHRRRAEPLPGASDPAPVAPCARSSNSVRDRRPLRFPFPHMRTWRRESPRQARRRDRNRTGAPCSGRRPHRPGGAGYRWMRDTAVPPSTTPPSTRRHGLTLGSIRRGPRSRGLRWPHRPGSGWPGRGCGAPRRRRWPRRRRPGGRWASARW